jgi:hypothetical protein
MLYEAVNRMLNPRQSFASLRSQRLSSEKWMLHDVPESRPQKMPRVPAPTNM